MNPDQLAPGERSASTSNRNFEGRQGKGGRTHLVSPLVAAATAVRGTLSSPADLAPVTSSASSSADRLTAPRPESRHVMEKFTTHTGVGVPLRRSNVDTDQIIPAVYLKRVTRTGFEDGLFSAWRNDPDVRAQRRSRYASGSVLVAGPGLRHRLVARARRLGAEGLRLPGRAVARGSRTSSAATRGKQGLLTACCRQERHRAALGRPRGRAGTEVTVDLAPGPSPAATSSVGVRGRRLHPLAADGGPGRHRSDPAARRRDRRVRGVAGRPGCRPPCPPADRDSRRPSQLPRSRRQSHRSGPPHRSVAYDDNSLSAQGFSASQAHPERSAGPGEAPETASSRRGTLATQRHQRR